MDESRAEVVQIKWLGRRSEVAVPVHVPLQRAINTGQHSVRSDVKLTAVDKQGLVDVALNDGSSVAISRSNLLNYTCDLA